jgi:hypothetical protein
MGLDTSIVAVKIITEADGETYQCRREIVLRNAYQIDRAIAYMLGVRHDFISRWRKFESAEWMAGLLVALKSGEAWGDGIQDDHDGLVVNINPEQTKWVIAEIESMLAGEWDRFELYGGG